jgi:hypothetical protein
MLGGCGGADKADSLSDFPEMGNGPGEAALRLKIKDYIARQKGPANSRYEYSLTDLNGDGRREGLVLFTLPYSYWCGWGGCSLAVFAANSDSFALMSEMTHVRGPIVVAKRTTNGWRDIVLRVSGTNLPDRTVHMTFGSNGYPSNPLGERQLDMSIGDIEGERFFP